MDRETKVSFDDKTSSQKICTPGPPDANGNVTDVDEVIFRKNAIKIVDYLDNINQAQSLNCKPGKYPKYENGRYCCRPGIVTDQELLDYINDNLRNAIFTVSSTGFKQNMMRIFDKLIQYRTIVLSLNTHDIKSGNSVVSVLDDNFEIPSIEELPEMEETFWEELNAKEDELDKKGITDKEKSQNIKDYFLKNYLQNKLSKKMISDRDTTNYDIKPRSKLSMMSAKARAQHLEDRGIDATLTPEQKQAKDAERAERVRAAQAVEDSKRAERVRAAQAVEDSKRAERVVLNKIIEDKRVKLAQQKAAATAQQKPAAKVTGWNAPSPSDEQKAKFAIEQKARVKALQDEENARNAAKAKSLKENNKDAAKAKSIEDAEIHEQAMNSCTGSFCGLFSRKKGGIRRKRKQRKTKKIRKIKSKSNRKRKSYKKK